MIHSSVLLIAVLFFAQTINAFQSPHAAVPLTTNIVGGHDTTVPMMFSGLYTDPAIPSLLHLDQSSSLTLSAVTLDPAAFFTNVLSGVLGTPLILAVPIVAAFALVGLMAALIIGYASPAADDD